MHVIRSVEVGMNHTVDVVWDDGRETTIDFASIIAKGGVFAAIAERAQFGQVAIGPRGRSLVWPEDIDFCADALYVADTMLTTA